MSDQRASPDRETSSPQTEPSPVQFPPLGFPLIYADDVANLSKAEHVIKFYITRDDPSILGQTRVAQRAPTAQIVMPVDGFIRAVLFLNHSLNVMVSENLITQAEIDRIRSNVRLTQE